MYIDKFDTKGKIKNVLLAIFLLVFAYVHYWFNKTLFGYHIIFYVLVLMVILVLYTTFVSKCLLTVRKPLEVDEKGILIYNWSAKHLILWPDIDKIIILKHHGFLGNFTVLSHGAKYHGQVHNIKEFLKHVKNHIKKHKRKDNTIIDSISVIEIEFKDI